MLNVQWAPLVAGLSVLTAMTLTAGCAGDSSASDIPSSGSESSSESSTGSASPSPQADECWPATPGGQVCGGMTATALEDAKGVRLPLPDALELTVLPSRDGDDHLLRASLGGCNHWSTPLVGDAPEWTPRLREKVASAMGCESASPEDALAEAILDAPFTAEMKGDQVVLRGDEGSLHLAPLGGESASD